MMGHGTENCKFVVGEHVCRRRTRKFCGRCGDRSIRAAFAEKFKIPGYVLNREEKMQDAL